MQNDFSNTLRQIRVSRVEDLLNVHHEEPRLPENGGRVGPAHFLGPSLEERVDLRDVRRHDFAWSITRSMSVHLLEETH